MEEQKKPMSREEFKILLQKDLDILKAQINTFVTQLEISRLQFAEKSGQLKMLNMLVDIPIEALPQLDSKRDITPEDIIDPVTKE